MFSFIQDQLLGGSSSSNNPKKSSAMVQQKVARSLLKRHPMQKFDSPSRGTSALLHILGLSSFAYSYSLLLFEPSPITESYGWHLQYLTIIGLTLSAITFTLGLLSDITLSPTLFRAKNILSVASAPMECLITLLYWSLRQIDPKLVVSEWAPPMDFHADLSFHAVPAVSLVIDLLLFSPPYTIAFLPALSLSGVIAFGYWFWIEQCYYYNKFYPYPIFEMLSTPQRIGLFASSALLMTFATGLLVWLYRLVNGPLRKEHKGDPKQARPGLPKRQKSSYRKVTEQIMGGMAED